MTAPAPSKQTPLDRASESDRQYFLSNPKARERLRQPIAGEFDFDDVTVFLPPGAMVRVVQLYPGARVREVVA